MSSLLPLLYATSSHITITTYIIILLLIYHHHHHHLHHHAYYYYYHRRVFYNDLSDIEEAVRSLNPTVLKAFEASCFNGLYVTPEVGDDDIVMVILCNNEMRCQVC